MDGIRGLICLVQCVLKVPDKRFLSSVFQNLCDVLHSSPARDLPYRESPRNLRFRMKILFISMVRMVLSEKSSAASSLL